MRALEASDGRQVTELWERALGSTWPVDRAWLDRVADAGVVVDGRDGLDGAALLNNTALVALVVDPRVQRAGIGRRLLAAASPSSVGSGGSAYFWPGVPDNLDAARAFFSSAGWADDYQAWDHTVDLETYEPPLPTPADGASAARSGEHLRSAFARGDRWIAADELTAALQGILEVHLAALSGSGAPLVAPVDAIFYRGKLWIGLPGASLRSRLIRRDPRVSVSFTSGDLALIVHGSFKEVPDDEAQSTGYTPLVRELYTKAYGDWFSEWLDNKERANDLTGFVEPRVMFAKR